MHLCQQNGCSSRSNGVRSMADWSQTWTFFDGEWREGNVPLWGVRTHAIWLGSSVFDGARIFEGTAPDLDLHCARVNASAKTMFLKPIVSMEQWIGLTHEGMKKFPAGTTLYVRPMYWAERAGPMALPGDPESTRLCAHALRRADAQARRLLGHAVAVQAADHRVRPGRCQGRLPLSEQRPRHVRSEIARLRQLPGLRHAGQRGRACQLQRVHGQGRRGVHAGAERHLPERHHPPAHDQADARSRRSRCVENVLRYRDFEAADEIFATGNASKVLPVTRIGERALQPGPLYRKARELYWAFAHGS